MSEGRQTPEAVPGEDRSLELSVDEMRRLIEAATDRIVEFVDSLPGQPASELADAAEVARSLIEPLPRRGTPFEELIELLFERVVPLAYNTTSPGYLAYIPGGGLVHSAIADLIADATNRYSNIWLPAPALAQIEVVVLRWLCEIVGYPPEALGLLTTGGSMANFTAVVTARHEKLPRDFLTGTIYASDQIHHSLEKAAMLAGFPAGGIRSIPSDDLFRVRVDEMRRRIAADRDAGFTPFMVVGSAGTVNTGAVDDLAALADLAADERLWFHVDAAYGGFFMLTDYGRAALAGIERSDSLILDPHKGLFLPYGTGSLLVRDREALRRAHTVGAGYLPTMQQDPDFVDFADHSPELSRDHRGLRVWLPLKMHGIDVFRRNLEEKLELTRWVTDRLRTIDGIEIVAEPQLSIVAFRLTRPGWSPRKLNALNARFLEAINKRRRVFLSSTTLGDDFVLRICVLSFRTHLDRMEQAIEDIETAAREVFAGA